MSNVQKRAVTAYRRKLKRQGIIRLELHVRKDDADLVRGVARALSNPEQEAEARALLRERFGGRRPRGLKALLAAAPLEGIDLARGRDLGRSDEL